MRAGVASARPSAVARLRGALMPRPDAVTLALGTRGELLVAQVRVALLCVLLAIQLVPGLAGDTRRVTLPLTLVSLALAGLILYLASRRPQPWLEGFASSAVDVTLVSCGLATFFLLDQPHTALNNRTLFEVYFLAIACAGLRYNPQACAMTGLLALAQYAAIVLYGANRWNLNDPRYAPFREGMFDWNAQGARLILLAAAALVSALIVLRTQGLRELSDTDLLTGVASRRVFDERLALEAGRARRYSRPFAIAVIDVDHFKLVNDTLGHAAGDMALRRIAGLLGGSLRETDLVARFGGDEFTVLLPETTAELMMDRLDALRRAVAAADVGATLARGAGAPRITLSIGVASWPDDGALPHVVLASADARLYEAKRRGRDCIVGPPRRWDPLPDEPAR